jgi:hypothetical protein
MAKVTKKLNPVVSAEKMALFAKLEKVAARLRRTHYKDFDARLPLTREAHRLLRDLRKVR